MVFFVRFESLTHVALNGPVYFPARRARALERMERRESHP